MIRNRRAPSAPPGRSIKPKRAGEASIAVKPPWRIVAYLFVLFTLIRVYKSVLEWDDASVDSLAVVLDDPSAAAPQPPLPLDGDGDDDDDLPKVLSDEVPEITEVHEERQYDEGEELEPSDDKTDDSQLPPPRLDEPGADEVSVVQTASSNDDSKGALEISDAFGIVRFENGEFTRFQPQIELPKKPVLQHFDDGKNYWPLHRILRERGWTYASAAPKARVNLFLTKGAVPPFLRKRSQMVNSIGVSGCIGGSKTLQLSCRKKYAASHGCSFDSLGISPVQYNLLDKNECKRFFVDAAKPEHEKTIWMSKKSFTFHGAGIEVHSDLSDLTKKFGSCATERHVVLMQYVSNPATMEGGYKFDFRSYVLVASLRPKLVFVADGFVRKSDTKYDKESTNKKAHITNAGSQSSKNHLFDFKQMLHALDEGSESSAPSIDELRDKLNKISEFVWRTTSTQTKKLSSNPGRFHLFGIDFVLDAKGRVHLLEGNGYPLVTDYPSLPTMTPKLWEDLVDLVLLIHVDGDEAAKARMTVSHKYAFGKWRLIYNEMEDQGSNYDPCTIFPL